MYRDAFCILVCGWYEIENHNLAWKALEGKDTSLTYLSYPSPVHKPRKRSSSTFPSYPLQSVCVLSFHTSQTRVADLPLLFSWTGDNARGISWDE